MEKKAALAHKAQEMALAHSAQFTENTIYLMGLSFMLGSFFTILVLIRLDFMRRDQADQ